MFSSFICTDDSDSSLSLCISYNGFVYSFGYSKFKAHGHNEEQINIPTQISTLTNIKMLACGDHHTVCLDYYGSVFSFGSNYNNQLGIGKTKKEIKYTNIPQKVNLPPCKQISCGDNNSMCLSEDLFLYSFGENNIQLGIENYSLYPQQIKSLSNIEYIICGGEHAICKTYSNEYFSWGNNNRGQLGKGDYESSKKPIICCNWPENIMSIKCGYNNTIILTEGGYVYTCGSNYAGKLGLGDSEIKNINIPTLIKDIPEIQRIECGYENTYCIDINYHLWVFGINQYGQLGLGDDNHRFKPTLHPDLNNVIDISSGGYHSFFKTIDNKIYTCGKNNYSQLGIKISEEIYKENVKKPTQVFVDNEDIWCSTIGKSTQKSARK